MIILRRKEKKPGDPNDRILHDKILKQAKTGVVVIPPDCELLYYSEEDLKRYEEDQTHQGE